MRASHFSFFDAVFSTGWNREDQGTGRTDGERLGYEEMMQVESQKQQAA